MKNIKGDIDAIRRDVVLTAKEVGVAISRIEPPLGHMLEDVPASYRQVVLHLVGSAMIASALSSAGSTASEILDISSMVSGTPNDLSIVREAAGK